jgi:hypothetical protein
MKRAELMQEIRKMRFEESYGGWQKGRLSQEEAAEILGVCSRTFRRQIGRYEENGLEGLNDKRLTQASHRRAPVDRELTAHNITNIDAANSYLKKIYQPAFNKEFRQEPLEEGLAFIPRVGTHIEDTLCEHYERTVSPDNCVSFEGKTLQIPPDKYRCHYVRVKVRVHLYIDGSLAIFHGPRKLADYDENGDLKKKKKEKAA